MSVFTRRDWLIGLLIVLLAFVIRLVIIVDRAHDPVISALTPLPQGTDQLTYTNHIAAYRAGNFPPPGGYTYQPGMSWFLIVSSKILGTDDLVILRLFVAALASINCGLMIALTRLAFDRRWIGALAGLLLAVYPVGAFYDTDFVITSQAIILVSLALFGTLWLWRFPRNWTGAIILGLSLGAIVITRLEILAIGPVVIGWLIWQRRDRLILQQLGLTGILALVVIQPVIVYNRAEKAGYLIAPNGMIEVYRGNNRDADGTRTRNPASESVGQENLTEILWHDVRLSPRRFGELVLHKIGLYFSPNEPGNNLSYVKSGEAVSPLLRIIPLDFRILLALYLFGLAAVCIRREPTAILFGLVFLALMAGNLTLWVEARLRTPVIAAMMPIAAYGLAYAVETIRSQRTPRAQPVGAIHELPLRETSLKSQETEGNSADSLSFPLSGGSNQSWQHVFVGATRRVAQVLHKRREPLKSILRLLAPIPIIAAILIAAHLTEKHLPRPRTADSLPSSAQPINATYDGTLKLVGWEIQDEYSRAGIIEPFRPYVVTFYWELLKPATTDYSFALVYLVDGERVTGFDRPVGTVSYPATPSSEWKPGRIYVEHASFTYKRFDGPIEISGDLLLAVYPERNAGHLLPAEGLPDKPLHIRLTQLAIIWGPGILPDSLPLQDDPIPFGDVLRLKGWDYPAVAAPGETIPIRLGWQTTGNPIRRPYIFAVHLYSAGDEPVTQADSPPHNGNLLAPSLPANFLFTDEKQLTLPDDPGTYRLYALVYDLDTGQRLAVPNAPDNLFPLGQIEVK